ncbi:MAG: hypothetical protein JST80_01015 [Bdellovibrionales bacterium]|nr:hypothetical protein [Bdellovibrionales bacterium]
MLKKRVCLLTCEDIFAHPDGKLAQDDDFLVTELERQGYSVRLVAWNRFNPSEKFDAVMVRTTWDYTQRCDEFLERMEAISLVSPLFNPFSILKWNSHKSYLLDLLERGVPVVSTWMLKPTDSLREIEHDLALMRVEEWIFKPAISATSEGLSRVKRYELSAALLQSQASGRDYLIQPYLPEISTGEISLNFFGKKFSHAVVKSPKGGDFRVQEAYGGTKRAYVPTEAEIQFGERVLQKVPDPLLVARVDFIQTSGGPVLMELELIEPMLFFGTSTELASANFVSALNSLI